MYYTMSNFLDFQCIVEIRTRLEAANLRYYIFSPNKLTELTLFLEILLGIPRMFTT